jgi:N4-gp56 family major capsid protein
MTTQVTTGLTQEMMTYYESKFLERAKVTLIHKEGAQNSTHGKNQGKTVNFTLYAPLTTISAGCGEGVNPAEVDISASTVPYTLAEYGNVIKLSKLLSLTSIDREAAEKVSLLGQNMGESIDELTRTAIYTGATAQLAGGKALLSLIAASDTLSSAEIRKAIRTLKKNKAMRYPDGFFMGKVGPDTAYDLMGDTTWVNAKTYSDTKDLYNGEVGELHGARMLETNNQKSESSTVTVYSNFFHGANSFGCYDLESDTPKLYIKVPGDQDTSNATNRYSTIGWAGAYAAKVLIATWIINVKTGATA